MAELENPFGFTLRPEAPSLTGLDRVWEDLSVAAEYPGSQPDGRALAERINTNLHVDQFTPAIASALYDMLEELAAQEQPDEASTVRLSRLLIHLNVGILATALRTETNSHRRNTILQSAVKVLTIRAMLRLAQGASLAYHQPFSPPLRRLLKRIGRDAVTPGATQAAAQDLFRRILSSKFVEVRRRADDNVVKHGYKDMFEHSPPRRTPDKTRPEAERVVQTAIETDAIGEVVWVAVSEMIESRNDRELVSMVTIAPREGRVANLVIGRIAHQPLLARLLREEQADFAAIDLLLEPMGIASAKVMIEELAESRSRITRREVFSRLSKLGPEIGPLIEVRLKDRRWFVLRNMIALAREAGCNLDWHLMEPFLAHNDARVRREALLLLLRHGSTYEPALTKALDDADRNVLRTALQAARSRLPEDAVPVLADRVTSASFPPEFRVMGLHLLGRSNSPLALDALLQFAQAGRTLLGKPKLADKSPEMLAALSNLARTWPGERRVAALLASAQKSKDDDILAVATPA